jgi:hypothetical protein
VGIELPVGYICIWNDGNGFDDNLVASKTLAKADHQGVYAAHFVFIVSSSVKVHADERIRCLNAEELIVRHVAKNVDISRSIRT